MNQDESAAAPIGEIKVPESQLWTLEEPHRSRIARGLDWAGQTEPRESDLDSLLKEKGKRPKRLRLRRK